MTRMGKPAQMAYTSLLSLALQSHQIYSSVHLTYSQGKQAPPGVDLVLSKASCHQFNYGVVRARPCGTTPCVLPLVAGGTERSISASS